MQISSKINTASLTVHLSMLLLGAGIAAALCFCTLFFGGSAWIAKYGNDVFQQRQLVEKRAASLTAYVQANNLTAKSASQLTAWVKKHPFTLLEIYRANILLYTSAAPDELMEEENEVEAPTYSWQSYYAIPFSDGEAEVVLYADESSLWYTRVFAGSLMLSILLLLTIFLRGCRHLVTYIGCLNAQIHAMEGGDLNVPITIQGHHELSELARSLNAMQTALREQRAHEAELLQASQTMITEMSHDLRTPLTTLQIYTDILRYRKCTPDQITAYLEKIDGKAGQIKQLAENIFEYSLVSHSQKIQLNTAEPCRSVFHDALSELAAALSEQGLTVQATLCWPQRSVRVYPQYIKRLLDNICSNLIKYAERTAPVELAVASQEETVAISFANRIAHGASEQDRNGIGISNMKTMMKKMNGRCEVQADEERFAITLYFPAESTEIKNS